MGTSRTKSLQDKQLLAFPSRKPHFSVACELLWDPPSWSFWPLSEPLSMWLTRQQPGPLPKLVTPETVNRCFRKLSIRSLPASFAFRLCSVGPASPALRAHFEPKFKFQLSRLENLAQIFQGWVLGQWLWGQEWRSWRVTTSRLPWAVPF